MTATPVEIQQDTAPLRRPDANLQATMSLLHRVSADLDLLSNEGRGLAPWSLEVRLIEASHCVHRALVILCDDGAGGIDSAV
jgi:hypothetical protein